MIANNLNQPLAVVGMNCFPSKSLGREQLTLADSTPVGLASIPAAAKMAIIQTGSNNNTTARIDWTTDAAVTLDGSGTGIRQTFGDLICIHGQGAMSEFQIITTVADSIAEVEYFA